VERKKQWTSESQSWRHTHTHTHTHTHITCAKRGNQLAEHRAPTVTKSILGLAFTCDGGTQKQRQTLTDEATAQRTLTNRLVSFGVSVLRSHVVQLQPTVATFSLATLCPRSRQTGARTDGRTVTVFLGTRNSHACASCEKHGARLRTAFGRLWQLIPTAGDKYVVTK
jgi:hypothetical protein